MRRQRTPDEPLDRWTRDRGPHSKRWDVLLYSTGLEIRDDRGALLLDSEAGFDRVQVRPARFGRSKIHVAHDPAGTPAAGTPAAGTGRRLRGLRRSEARRLSQALSTLRLRHEASAALRALAQWHAHVESTLEKATTDLRWVPTETVRSLAESRPADTDTLQHLMVPPLWGTLAETERRALRTSADDVRRLAGETNARIERDTLSRQRTFFNTIETSPLTDEQARAVLTYDNRVHVIASAGSGKTSVMVGRAAYAVSRGFVAPEKVLLLAFNKAAADELNDRIDARFSAAGITGLPPTTDGDRRRGPVLATTFHAFGLDVIGQVTGKKPTVAPWVADGQDATTLTALAAELSSSNPKFAHAWDMFRLLYARVSDDYTEQLPADGWDKRTRTAGLQTFGGDVVRSQGERLLADWLYLNHVTYQYERPYAHDTSSASRRQYQPDFFYPGTNNGAGTWHEHWGLDEHGNPPPTWRGYLESMRWKRQLHRDNGTDLIETTWAGVMNQSDFPRLAADLDKRGITRRWDPSRPSAGAAPVKDADIIRLVRTFMVHVKSNSLTRADVDARLNSGRLGNTARAALFLDLYWPLHDAWQSKLAAGGYVDFEDMLVDAAGHIESGRFVSDYELVMVDEFQDTSQARARLVRALVAAPNRYLLAVGDDWQSIYRWAGSDLNVLTRFHQQFGPGPLLYLTTTFRCHQTIAETATAFVSRNPGQLRKNVSSVHTWSTNQSAHEGVQVHHVADSKDVPAAIDVFLAELAAAHRDGLVRTRAKPGVDGVRRVSVDVLGRYHHDRNLVRARRYDNLEVTFRTVHTAKGLEADYVVVPNLTAGTFGFPSQITDDPVLNLVMAEPDGFEHAEERRLLYVALTRARLGVFLVAVQGNESSFVTELLADPRIRRTGVPVEEVEVCPACGRGTLRPRQGPYGAFLGCSTFPACQHTTPIPSASGSGADPDTY